MVVDKLVRHADIGLLVIRVFLGVMFVYYGAPKLFAGPEGWAKLGQATSGFGIHAAPAFWGFMASFSMFAGGICVALGLFFRIFTALLFMTMVVAARMHFQKGDGLFGAAHALEDGVVFFGLTFIGPGRYSLDAWLARLFA